jgi:hypothetical protein
MMFEIVYIVCPYDNRDDFIYLYLEIVQLVCITHKEGMEIMQWNNKTYEFFLSHALVHASYAAL